MMRFFHRNGFRKLSVKEKSVLKDQIFQQLNLEGQSRMPVRKLSWQWMAAASIVIAAAGIYMMSRVPGKSAGKTLLAVRTGAGEMKKILLPDSSEVILNANSSLEYPSDLSYTESRTVTLKGNAFFRIKKDAAIRRFVVHARSLDVTVLGTELNVDARTPETEVTLVSGKVKVSKGAAHPVYLLPGDKVRLDEQKGVLVSSVTNTLLYSAWTDGQWNFRHTSLEEIAKLLGEYYGTEIVFHNERSKKLSINAVIAVGSLQKLIPVLEQTLHVKMVVSGNRLTIE